VGENTLSNFGKLVEEAQASKAPMQRIADEISAYFVPVVIIISIVVFFIWYALAATERIHTSMEPLPFALQFGLSLLVISCPCAFGLAVPTAIMVGTSVGARLGILFKSGPILEMCHQVNTVVFDKTGTLTHGKLKVTEYQISDKYSEHQFFYYVGSAELGSEHILGTALSTYAQEYRLCALVQPNHFQATPGKGLECAVDGKDVLIGNLGWLQDHGMSVSEDVTIEVQALERKGRTVVHVAIDREFVGIVALADILKPEAKLVVSELEKMGVEVWMVSGDNQKTAEAIAQELGITKVMGGVLPNEKVDKIKELQSHNKVVAMVGDGINDSPALAQANVGIAVGAGTDIALSAADVVLVKNDLCDVLITLDLSKKIFSRIRCNFAWAFCYNLLGVPLAAGVFYVFANIAIPPAIAGLSEILSSVPVVVFSLLLQRYVPPQWRY